MRPALTSQEPVGHADVGAEELHWQLAKLVKGARRPVLPNPKGGLPVGEAELPGLEGATGREGGVDEGKVDAGTAWPVAFALPQGCGQQEDLEVDGELGEAAICRERPGPGASATPARWCGAGGGGGQELQWGGKSSPHCGQWALLSSDLAVTSCWPPTAWNWGLSTSSA